MPKRAKLTGIKFGRLLVLNFYDVLNGKSRWECQCDCGNKIIVDNNSLQSRHTQSCGCLRADIQGTHNLKHGMKHTRIYRIWQAMKNRCANSKTINYKYYGGRGIIVCNAWRDNFMDFYDWSIKNGYTEQLTIDRINNDGNYEPSNCQWITMENQSKNKSNNKK